MEFRTERLDESLQLRGEHNSVLARDVVQGLDPKLVASEEQRTGRLIEHGKRKHASKPSQALRSPTPPCFEYDLSVRRRRESGSTRDQFGSDLPIVVQLAVVAERERQLDQGLLSVPEIDDRKAPVGKLHMDPLVRVGVRALFVGTTVPEALAHDLSGLLTVYLLV